MSPSGSADAATTRPTASVVMTVYRDFRFLDAAVASVLDQEFADFELIIVDDGNGDDTLFEALARRDPRIRIVSMPANVGTAAAANAGIAQARGDIIVRLDADDLAEPSRLGRLLAALAEEPQLGLIGSAVMLIDEDGRPLRVQPMPETDAAIRFTILFHNPFYHSATAFRRDLYESAGRYDVTELISQDHHLWFHLLDLCRAKNLAVPLTRYRVNSLGLTALNSANKPRARTHAIRVALWARIGLRYDLHDDRLARAASEFLRGQELATETRAAVYRTILKVLAAFLRAHPAFAGSWNADDARRFASALVARILAQLPDDTCSALATCRLCWPIDRRAAMRAFARRLFGT